MHGLIMQGAAARLQINKADRVNVSSTIKPSSNFNQCANALGRHINEK